MKGIDPIGMAKEEAQKQYKRYVKALKEKTLLQEFFGRLGRGDNKVVYGKSEVQKAYEEGRLTHLIVSESEGEIEEQGALRVSSTTEEGTMFVGLGGWAGYLKY